MKKVIISLAVGLFWLLPLWAQSDVKSPYEGNLSEQPIGWTADVAGHWFNDTIKASDGLEGKIVIYPLNLLAVSDWDFLDMQFISIGASGYYSYNSGQKNDRSYFNNVQQWKAGIKTVVFFKASEYQFGLNYGQSMRWLELPTGYQTRDVKSIFSGDMSYDYYAGRADNETFITKLGLMIGGTMPLSAKNPFDNIYFDLLPRLALGDNCISNFYAQFNASLVDVYFTDEVALSLAGSYAFGNFDTGQKYSLYGLGLDLIRVEDGRTVDIAKVAVSYFYGLNNKDNKTVLNAAISISSLYNLW